MSSFLVSHPWPARILLANLIVCIFSVVVSSYCPSKGELSLFSVPQTQNCSFLVSIKGYNVQSVEFIAREDSCKGLFSLH
jgi:hypothetical protein